MPHRNTHSFATRAMLIVTVFATALCMARQTLAAERIKIGILKTSGFGPLYLAKERGYFSAENLDAELVTFTAAQPVAVATVSGDLDFGVMGLTAAFYNLAGQGALRVIAGYIREVPNFQTNGYIVSNAAFAGGLTSFKNLSGRSVAVPFLGSPPHYSVGLLAEKYGFDLKSLRILPLQSNPNMVTAVVGGQADTTIVGTSFVLPALQRGQAKLLGWVGDETPFQLGAVITGTKSTNERADTVERFLRAYRKGTKDYHDAFTGPSENRQDNSTTADVLAIIAKYVEQPVEVVKQGISYIDAEGRLDDKDVLRQIAWYTSQNMVNRQVAGDEIIDKRYVKPLR
jgi:NitT/TauT family transport system substrate-binding protein